MAIESKMSPLSQPEVVEKPQTQIEVTPAEEQEEEDELQMEANETIDDTLKTEAENETKVESHERPK